MNTMSEAIGSKGSNAAPAGDIARTPSTSARQRKLLLYPTLIIVVLITQAPLVVTIVLSLLSWTVIRPDLGVDFVGFANYVREVFSTIFLDVLVQTLILTAVSLILCCLIGLGLALLLNRRFAGKGLIQTLLVTPFFIMPVVIGLIWKNELFSPNFGLVTWFVSLFGVEGFNPMADQPLMMVATMVTWQWEPLFMLVLLAGLQSIPDEEREAAQLDGCGRWRVFGSIELPHLMPYYRMVLLLGCIFVLQIFGQIYTATAGGPGHSSMNLQYLTYQTGLVGWEIGAASALGIATLIVTLVILGVLLKGINRLVKEF